MMTRRMLGILMWGSLMLAWSPAAAADEVPQVPDELPGPPEDVCLPLWPESYDPEGDPPPVFIDKSDDSLAVVYYVPALQSGRVETHNPPIMQPYIYLIDPLADASGYYASWILCPPNPMICEISCPNDDQVI